MNKYKIFNRAFFCFVFCLFQLLSGTQIHIFGDSHASFCFSNNERRKIPCPEEHSFFNYGNKPIPFNIYWLGPKTMYGIGKGGSKLFDLKSYRVKQNDVAVFVFGEIDVRCHIEKQKDLQNCSLENIVDRLVNNFFKTIDENRALLDGLCCVIVSVMPPTNLSYNPQVPYYGTLSKRVEITQLLNVTLKHICKQYDFNFLDIYPFYTNDIGALDDSKSDGVVHVNPIYNGLIKTALFDLLSNKFPSHFLA